MVKTPQQILDEINVIYIPNTVGRINAPNVKGTFVDVVELIDSNTSGSVPVNLGATRTIVTSMALSSPPGVNPPNNTAYVVAATGAGSWTGQTKSIAIFSGTGYIFVIPVNGTKVYDRNTSAEYQYDGVNWILIVSGVGDMLLASTQIKSILV